MPDVVELIEKDHREVEQLFAEFRSKRDARVAERICDELTRHTVGEESAVYPVVAGEVSDGDDLSDEAIEEHKEARQLVGRIRNTTDADHLAELMAQLEEAVQHHVHEEETEMLPRARREIPTEELDEMAQSFEEAKEAAGRQSA